MPTRFRPLAAAAAITLAAATAVIYGAGPAYAQDSATINGGTTYQTMAGFGASEGFGQAETIMAASSATQTQALNYLYSTSSGAGLDILRNEISADPGDTIEPTPPTAPSATPSYVSLASIDDDQGQLWLAQTIKADYGVTNVFADAWSAPAFMKVDDETDNGSALCGVSGATCSSGSWVQAYVQSRGGLGGGAPQRLLVADYGPVQVGRPVSGGPGPVGIAQGVLGKGVVGRGVLGADEPQRLGVTSNSLPQVGRPVPGRHPGVGVPRLCWVLAYSPGAASAVPN